MKNSVYLSVFVVGFTLLMYVFLFDNTSPLHRTPQKQSIASVTCIMPPSYKLLEASSNIRPQLSHPLDKEQNTKARQATFVLKRPLSRHEAWAINEAHWVGYGELGKDKKNLATIGNYTQKHIWNKAKILDKAHFSWEEIRLLMETGTVGLRGISLGAPTDYSPGIRTGWDAFRPSRPIGPGIRRGIYAERERFQSIRSVFDRFGRFSTYGRNLSHFEKEALALVILNTASTSIGHVSSEDKVFLKSMGFTESDLFQVDVTTRRILEDFPHGLDLDNIPYEAGVSQALGLAFTHNLKFGLHRHNLRTTLLESKEKVRKAEHLLRRPLSPFQRDAIVGRFFLGGTWISLEEAHLLEKEGIVDGHAGSAFGKTYKSYFAVKHGTHRSIAVLRLLSMGKIKPDLVVGKDDSRESVPLTAGDLLEYYDRGNLGSYQGHVTTQVLGKVRKFVNDFDPIKVLTSNDGSPDGIRIVNVETPDNLFLFNRLGIPVGNTGHFYPVHAFLKNGEAVEGRVLSELKPIMLRLHPNGGQLFSSLKNFSNPKSFKAVLEESDQALIQLEETIKQLGNSMPKELFHYVKVKISEWRAFRESISISNTGDHHDWGELMLPNGVVRTFSNSDEFLGKQDQTIPSDSVKGVAAEWVTMYEFSK
jgi:hypothetical protein